MAFFEYITMCIPNVDTELKRRVKDCIPYRNLWAIIAAKTTSIWWSGSSTRLPGQEWCECDQIWGSEFQLLYFVRNVIAHRLTLLCVRNHL